MVRKTKAEAEQTRTLILDTAERLFAERGVSRTSLADIAQAAGLTRGAIYWHFANKVELFDAMHARIHLPLNETLVRIEAHAEPIEAVRELCLRELLELAADPQKQRVMDVILHKCEYVDEMGQICGRFEDHICEVLETVERAFERARHLGQLAAGVEPKLAARVLHNLMLGTFNDWLFAPARYDLAAQAGPMLDVFFRGLRASTG